MSDEFSKSSLRFKREVTVTEPEIHYAGKAYMRKILFAVDIPFPLLKEWHKMISCSPGEGTSGEICPTGSEDEKASSTQTTQKLDYVDLLEYCIPCNLFVFTDDKSITDEISVHLSKLAGTVVQSYRKLKGRARHELDEKVKKRGNGVLDRPNAGVEGKI